MADFINTIDVLGDDAVFDSIINGSIIEFKDDKVTFIGDYAFNGCAALTTVEIPNATYVCQKGFNGCSELQNVSIPKVSTLYDSAFNSCKKLKSIVMPAIYNMTSACFENCTALEMVDIHTVCPIKARNFYGCSALKALIIRGTTGVSAMSLTDSLINTPITNGNGYIYVPSALIDSYKAANNWSNFADQFRKLEEWTVDGTVTGAFDANRHMVRFFNEDGTFLGYVIVPAGGNAACPGGDPVKEGEWEFTGWNPAPTNVTADMDCYAQFRDTALVSRKLVERKIVEYKNDRVTTVGAGAFSYFGSNGLVRLDFPAVTAIGTEAFAYSNLLEVLILRNTTKVVELEHKGAFTSTKIASGTGYIYVPAALVDSYKADTNWSNYASKFRAIEDYPDICGGGL